MRNPPQRQSSFQLIDDSRHPVARVPIHVCQQPPMVSVLCSWGRDPRISQRCGAQIWGREILQVPASVPEGRVGRSEPKMAYHSQEPGHKRGWFSFGPLFITLSDLPQTITDTADIFLKGTGILNRWKWPDIEGLHSFKGPVLHSARWDPSFDWSDKTVALIGAGSTGIQILPKIQPKAKRVIHYMKGKTWISPVGYGAEQGVEDENGKF